MRYKIEREPFYYLECLYIVQNIINRKSINDELDSIVKKRGSAVRRNLEPLFGKAAALEEYIKVNLRFDLPCYEKNGEEMAEFLFKLRGRLEDAPAYAFFCYEQLKKYSKADKRLAILAYALEEKFYADGWDENPPALDSDKDFLEILDADIVDSAEKFDLIKLYHNFDVFHDYTTNCLDRAIDLYKEKLSDFSQLSNATMDYLDNQLNEKGSSFFKDALGIAINDDIACTICPSVYNVNSVKLNGVTRWDFHIIIGIHFFDIANILESRVEFANESIQDFLKCVADNTKLSILQLIKKEPMYGSQLAEKLNLTTATISHHMSTLLKLKLVYAEKENNKIFFHLDHENLNDLLSNFQRLFA